jgi:hypothetical protein
VQKTLVGLVITLTLAAAPGCNCLCSQNNASVAALPTPKTPAPLRPGQPWSFVVSGDSRNCGDVVMPAIAQGADRNNAQFYWHLGDLRAIYTFDEDMQQIAKLKNKPLNISDYENQAWDDFIENQINVFGSIPYYLGIGNHETIPPKTREQFKIQFADWLSEPVLQQQRLQDNHKWQEQKWIDDREADRNARQVQTYYHWRQGAVDFIYLDNASDDQFDDAQMEWLDRVLKTDAADDSLLTVAVGMHKALPFSISCDHSMNESGTGERSGRKVYSDLLDVQNSRYKNQPKNHPKNVYVLASHSHFFMADTYNTRYWLNHGGVLPGWIIGTGGAQRYRLPKNKTDAAASAEDTYGYLVGTVRSDGKIDFVFKEVKESAIPSQIMSRYTGTFVHNTCFEGNKRMTLPDLPDFCAEVAEPVTPLKKPAQH